MHDVRELKFGTPCKTALWFSAKAERDLGRFRKKGDPDKSFWKQLKRCSENGFALYEAGDWPKVKEEWDGAWRFGIRVSLFRLIGFYEDDSKASFIVIDAFFKSGQGLSDPERRRIDEVARIKRQALWRKVNDEQNFPRAAQ